MSNPEWLRISRRRALEGTLKTTGTLAELTAMGDFFVNTLPNLNHASRAANKVSPPIPDSLLAEAKYHNETLNETIKSLREQGKSTEAGAILASDRYKNAQEVLDNHDKRNTAAGEYNTDKVTGIPRLDIDLYTLTGGMLLLASGILIQLSKKS